MFDVGIQAVVGGKVVAKVGNSRGGRGDPNLKISGKDGRTDF